MEWRRTLCALGLVVTLAGACVTPPPASTPSPSPTGAEGTPTPSRRPSPPPTAPETGSPEPTQTAAESGVPPWTPFPTASQSPDTTASAEPGTTASAAPATVLAFHDDFRDPESGWRTPDDAAARVAYRNGALVLNLAAPSQPTWTTRNLLLDWPVVTIHAAFAALRPAGATGYYGLLCGPSDEDFYLGLLLASGGWAFLHFEEGEFTVLDTEATAIPGLEASGPTELRLECLGATGAGPGRLRLGSSDAWVAETELTDGPRSFLYVGAYAETAAETDRLTVALDEISVWVSGRSDVHEASPSPSPTPSPSSSAGPSGSPSARPSASPSASPTPTASTTRRPTSTAPP